jgi:hypothetical protein
MNSRFSSIVLLVFSISCALPNFSFAGPLSETWQTGYKGDDLTGAHVLGCWQFQAGAETADSSGRGNTLKLAGAVATEQGKFGGALESFPGWPVEDKRHAALVDTKAALSPKGAFTVEMWIKPKAELTAELSPVLVDKKYVAHTDYQFRLTTADKSGARHLHVVLGFGDDSENFISQPFTPGVEWQHVAFTYDAAGTVRFFRNGAPLGSVTRAGRGPVAAGKHGLSLGDRVGSNYAGFPGFIDEVRICNGALEFRPIGVEFRAERRTWRRMEKAEPVEVVVRNLGKAAAKNLAFRVSLEGMGEQTFSVPELAGGASHTVTYDIDTSLRPDTYKLTARVELPGEMPFASQEFMEFTIAPRPLAKMPVTMWGLGSPDNVRQEIPRLKDLGFTQCLGGGADYASIWKAKKPVGPSEPERIAAVKGMLDFALANDFGIAFSLSPGGWLKDRPELQRVDRNGKPYAARPDVNASLPGLTDFCFNVGASIAQTYRAFPAWQATLIDSETRDSSQLSFSEHDQAAYRKFAGADIPAEAMTKSGVDWTKLKDFPKDRVIPDDDPLLRYYKWFWTVGDGWNALHTAVHKGVHSTGREDMWTWFDPTIRAPSVGGSGGEVDVLGQWTYTNPDPMRVGCFADELFAMAANSSQHPRVMKMTQLFWYRAQSAPKKEGAAYVASPFDDHDPDAGYITISPMHLREAFWTMISRPVSGIMYHGWQALVPTESVGGYRYTNPDTKEEFRRLHRDVLEKLGPMLLQLGDRRSDVAYLDSFTSQMFARRGTYGYSSDETYLTLLHAQLQPQVIYEDQVLREGLAPFKVLVLADCDVLTAGVAARIEAFQKSGGLIIGDENLSPAITPDIRIPKYVRTKKGDIDAAAILANAANLRAALEGKYNHAAESSNPEIVTRVRTSGPSEYVFAVNDRREFGTYVGQHGLVMENGLPSEGTLSLRREAGHVYDLLLGREVQATVEGGKLKWPVNLGPCAGGVFLVSPEAISSVKVKAPHSVPRGEKVDVGVTITNASGKAVPAAIPVKVEISDPAGRLAEFSGQHAAKNGRLDLHLHLAPNDAAGVWQVRVRELASGREAVVYLRVTES